MKRGDTHLVYAEKVEQLNSKAQEFYNNYDDEYSVYAMEAFSLADKYLLPDSTTYIDAVNLYSTVIFEKEDYKAVISTLKEYIDGMDIDKLSTESKDRFASTLNNLAAAYARLNNFDLASKYLQRSIKVKLLLNLPKRLLIDPYTDLIYIYQQAGQKDKVEGCYLELQEIIKEEFGESSGQYQNAVAAYINFLNKIGDKAKAAKIQKALDSKKQKQTKKGENSDFPKLIEEAKRAYLQGAYDRAAQLHKQIRQQVSSSAMSSMLELAGESFDPLLQWLAELDTAAQKLKASRKYDSACKHYQVMLEVISNSLGEQNIKYAFILNNYAGVTREMGDDESTERLLIDAVEISQLPINRNHEKGYLILDNLADYLYQRSCAYAPPADSADGVGNAMRNRKAPEDFAKSMRIQFLMPKEDESKSESIYREFNTRIVFYTSVGDLRIALRLAQDRNKLSRLINSDQPEKFLSDILELSRRYLELGEYREAEALINEAQEFSRDPKFEGDQWPVALAFNYAAQFYMAIRDTDRSISCFKKALAVLQESSYADSPAASEINRNLIKALIKSGRNEEAKPLIEKILKETDIDAVEDPVELEEYAHFLTQLRQYKQAESIYLKALHLLEETKGTWDMDYALTASNLATSYRFQRRFKDAIPLYEQALRARKLEWGELHPKLNNTMIRLALAYAGNEEPGKALEMMDYIERIDNIQLDTLFSMTSEKQKFEIAQQATNNMDVFLSVISKFYNTDKNCLMRALALLQRRKGNIAIHSLHINDIVLKSSKESVRKLFSELLSINKIIVDGAYSNKWKEDPKSRRLLEEVLERKEKLEAKLSSSSKEFLAFDPNEFSKLLNAIHPNVAILEIVRFSKFDFNADILQDEPESTSHYGVFIITNKKGFDIQFLELGDAEEIETWVGKAITSFQNDDVNKQIDLKRISFLLEDISEKLQMGFEHVVICPDGPLTLLPFDLLTLNKNERWVDHFKVSLFESTDAYLARLKGDNVSLTTPVVVANPDFDHKRGTARHSLTAEMQFSPLEGTGLEGKEVAAKLGAKTLFEKEATKENVQKLVSPHLLHIATHGFYIDTEEDAFIDPLVNAGLAFTGANIADENVGILTAKEVSFMNLKGTELVVLSACCTGQGEVVSGQGVFGLQQAFKLAGAKRVLATLREIPDWATVYFMNILYDGILRNLPVADALKQAKLDASSKYPDSDFWASFVLWGDPHLPLDFKQRKK